MAMRIGLWATMTVLAVLVALYGLTALVLPGFGPPFLAERRAETPWAVYAHLGGGLWALAAGPWQFNRRWRDAALRFHRWLGRSYVLGVIVGAVGALALAPRAQTGGGARAGFGLLGALWLTFTVLAFLSIRRRDQAAHRRWMLRSFALTLAAVTLRIYLPLSAAMGWSFGAAYPAIAWLCWVPNLLLSELYLLRGPRAVSTAAV
jgi:uncharacterized membrane protein